LSGDVDSLSGAGVLPLSVEVPRRGVEWRGRRIGPALEPAVVERQDIAVDEWSEDTVDDRDPLLPTARADVAEDDADRGALAAQPEVAAPLSRVAVRRHDPRWEPGALAAHTGIAVPTETLQDQRVRNNIDFGGCCLENSAVPWRSPRSLAAGGPLGRRARTMGDSGDGAAAPQNEPSAVPRRITATSATSGPMIATMKMSR
jgi:hypothetical protein